MWNFLQEVATIVGVGAIVGVVIYFAVSRLCGRKLTAEVDRLEADMESNGRNLRSLTAMIQNSPEDTGAFERIED